MSRVIGDSSDEGDYRYHLPRTRTPQPVMQGIRGWRTEDGYLVLRIHYSCDPDRATEEWKEEQVQGYRGGFTGSDWMREMEIDFGSYAGTPVYEYFDPNLSIKEVEFNPDLPLWRGWDFGYRHPAVTFFQLWPDDTLVQLHEVYPTLDNQKVPGIKTADLASLVIQETDRLFPEVYRESGAAGVFDFCDPAGNQKKETSDFSSIEILQQKGIDPEWSQVGRLNRISYLRHYVEGRADDGSAKFLIHPRCTLSIEAWATAYRFPDEKSGGSNREMPDTSKKIQEEPYIHLMDSAEYMAACCLGFVERMNYGLLEEAEEKKVTDLATAYLNPSGNAGSRVVSVSDRQEDYELETVLSDLIGEDSLTDPFSLH